MLIGYLETSYLGLYQNLKVLENARRIIGYLHRNYLVFVQFIMNNITDEQYKVAYDWAQKLDKVVSTRPVMKTLNNVYNSELLKGNNTAAMKLLMELLRIRPDLNEFNKKAELVLRNVETMKVLEVRDFIRTSVSYTLSTGETSARHRQRNVMSKQNSSQSLHTGRHVEETSRAYKAKMHNPSFDKV